MLHENEVIQKIDKILARSDRKLLLLNWKKDLSMMASGKNGKPTVVNNDDEEKERAEEVAEAIDCGECPDLMEKFGRGKPGDYSTAEARIFLGDIIEAGSISASQRGYLAAICRAYRRFKNVNN